MYYGIIASLFGITHVFFFELFFRLGSARERANPLGQNPACLVWRQCRQQVGFIRVYVNVQIFVHVVRSRRSRPQLSPGQRRLGSRMQEIAQGTGGGRDCHIRSNIPVSPPTKISATWGKWSFRPRQRITNVGGRFHKDPERNVASAPAGGRVFQNRVCGMRGLP